MDFSRTNIQVRVGVKLTVESGCYWMSTYRSLNIIVEELVQIVDIWNRNPRRIVI